MFARHVSTMIRGLDRRKRHRYPVIGPITVILYAGEEEVPCTLEDVSLGGARARLAHPVELGDEFELWHPSTGRFRGYRRWSTSRTLGFSFDNLEAATHICVQCLNQLLPKKRTVNTGRSAASS